jgi:hypothetical protein
MEDGFLAPFFTSVHTVLGVITTIRGWRSARGRPTGY